MVPACNFPQIPGSDHVVCPSPFLLTRGFLSPSGHGRHGEGVSEQAAKVGVTWRQFGA